MSEDTQFKKGVSGNANGRPKGSRNKSALVKSQLIADGAADKIARFHLAVMMGDADLLAAFDLKPSDVRMSHRLAAAKELNNQSRTGYKTVEDDDKKREAQQPKNPEVGSAKFFPSVKSAVSHIRTVG